MLYQLAGIVWSNPFRVAKLTKKAFLFCSLALAVVDSSSCQQGGGGKRRRKGGGVDGDKGYRGEGVPE